MKMLALALVATAAQLIAPLPVFAESTPTEYQAHYRAYSAGLPCGKGSVTLTRRDDGLMQYHAKGKACMFSQSMDHLSVFNLTPLAGVHYQTHFDGLFSERLLEGKFDGRHYQVNLNGTPLSTEQFAPATYEPSTLSYLLGHNPQSQQLSYTWGEETRDYWFAYLGTEQLDSAIGVITAHKFQQQHPNESRVATLWFSPEHDGLLIKAKVSRVGIPWLTIHIKDYQPL